MAPFKTLPVAIATFTLLQGLALQAQAQQASAEPAELDTVTISGRGETRQVSRISREDLAATSTGSSPIKALAKLPGVNFSSADALGNYEWGSRISIRGFSQNQLGFTLDDVPLGDMSYRNFNGLHISRAIASENIGRIVVSQGTGALGVASTSNLGGALQFYSADPADQRTITVEQTVGQDNNLRTFARFDSGLLSDDSTKFSLSAVRQYGDKWKGEGEQRHQQVNSKVVSRFGDAKLSAFFNWSDRREVDYMDLSKDSVRRLGYNWDYYAPDWQGALNSANGVWSRGETSISDAYYNGSGLREDRLIGATLDYFVNDAATIKTTVYHHDQTGTGTWWTPEPPPVSGPTLPVVLRTLEFDINRWGVLSALTLTSGIHTVNTGIWFEHNVFNHAMRFYSQDAGPSSPYSRPSNPYYTRWDYEFDTKTIQFHLQDTLKLSEQLTANVGFKAPRTTTKVLSSPGTDPTFNLQGELTAKSSFLPQAGLNFKLDTRNELFASAAKNIRAYRGVVKGGTSPFDTTQAGFDAVKDKIKPESSITVEGGWRYRDQALESSLTLYHVTFKNRLLALQQGTAVAGNASVLSNVGKVETRGVEAFVAWQPLTHVKWSNSLSYNDSKYKDDFTSDNVTYASGGKQVADAPKWIAFTQLAYDNGSLSGQIGANYIGKRYYTLVNDSGVAGYTLVDAGGGYRWKSTGWASEVRLRAGVSNLFDKRYFAIGDNPFPATDPNGQSYNILAGAPRTAYVTVGATF